MIKNIDFKPGDTVRVYQKVKEGGKIRTQVFQGVVLGIRGRNGNKTFIVRKLVEKIAVERIFPINSPSIEKVEVKGHPKDLPAGKAGKVRRAKLYYLRRQTT